MKLFKKRTSLSSAKLSERAAREEIWLQKHLLEVGMYVQELDRPWAETSFMFQGFRIDSNAVLQAVRESCENALIHTGR